MKRTVIRLPQLAVLTCVIASAVSAVARADTLDDIRARGELIWGADREGGGPYVYPDPADPQRSVGFEVELADLLARELGVKPRFFQGNWDNLPAVLGTGQIDIVMNGYELTPARAGMMLATHPYYIYEMVLLAPRDHARLKSWEDLRRKPGQPRAKVGVLVSSAAHTYLEQAPWPDEIDLRTYDSSTDALDDAARGAIDATLADLPCAVFYGERYPTLGRIGQPVGRGYYVIFCRQQDRRLRDALNEALVRLVDRGELRQVYDRYGLWSATQDELPKLMAGGEQALGIHATRLRGWDVIVSRGPILLKAAGMTVFLACASMPLAIMVGLAVAVGRMYGPAPLRWLLIAYVEVLRGTPLMLQLFVIYFLLPEIGIHLQALPAAILGLAVNYSAYEAEIYRAGLQAIPRGQMEAALALGMSKGLALRRIIVPQAVRIVIPPVTNDFIALFKDTSVCSVITVMELTKQYSVQRGNTGATVELAALTAILYLLMSVPLAHLVSRMEQRLGKRRGSD